MPAEEEPRVNPALAASEFHGRVGSAGPNSSPTEADGLAQSCVRAQARFPQRPDWPDPQSQSFSRSYGSNLPTSLTYIVPALEAVHLGDLLRIWVRPGKKITPPPSDFQGSTSTHRTPQDPRCFTEATPLSPDKPIPGGKLLTKKRELFLEYPPTSLSSFALPRLIPKDRSPSQGREC